jgi:hypothetical protein
MVVALRGGGGDGVDVVCGMDDAGWRADLGASRGNGPASSLVGAGFAS